MRRIIPFKTNPATKPNPFIFDLSKQHPKRTFSRQMIHSKTLRTAGRGGKGHFIGGAPSGWNRKGRWLKNETRKPS